MTYYQDPTVTIHHGDSLDVLRTLPDASLDSVVTDPPYGLEFMGKAWDSFGRDTGNGYRESPRINDRSGEGFPGHRGQAVNSFQAGAPFQRWCEAWATECLRVLKPGGHMLAFGGTRTWHRLACAVEDAGFEIRDSIAWLYGSGFPKSLDVSKAVDKAQGATGSYGEPKSAAHAGWIDRGRMRGADGQEGWQRPWMEDATALSNAARKYEPGSEAAQQWQGWGTALKPAFEPIVVARKPLAGTVAGNVLAHGTGALNVDGCRVGNEARPLIISKSEDSTGILGNGLNGSSHGGSTTAGRWPANVVLDESQAEVLDQQSGALASGWKNTDTAPSVGDVYGNDQRDKTGPHYADTGGASRFFYTAKAATDERVRVDGVAHPTVKPLALMRWLVRLVTPPGGTVLEPFAGSGTTVEACILEGFRCVAVEREAEYLPLITQRIHRRRDPVEAVKGSGEDGGLFDLLGEVGA